jgi:hypothetical protein
MTSSIESGEMITRLPYILAVLALAGCMTRSPQQIPLQAEVVQFHPQAHHMDWDDGRWATSDVVQLQILSPPEWAGKTLAVSIQPDNTNTFLRVRGSKCSFLISPDLMTPAERSHGELFEGALENLRRQE